jgi:hypothetical protein
MPEPNPVIVYDEEHLTPNDPNAEWLNESNSINPFDDPAPPFWINDWRGIEP